MPEGDTIFRAARTLHRALAGQVVTKFETQLVKLARVDVDTPLLGRTIESVVARGKWMSMYFSGNLVLLTHMLMSGSWHIYRPGEDWQRGRHRMRIAIYTANFVAVAFDVQVAEFHTEEALGRHPRVRNLGPDVLAEEFDVEEAVPRLQARPDLQIGDALLAQSIVSGLGNVYKSEVCFACGVHPFRKTGSLTADDLRSLIAHARKFMLGNVGEASGAKIVTYTGLRRTTGRSDPAERLWVYGRRGEPCRRCGTAIVSRKQGEGARITFWCPQCQPMQEMTSGC